MIQVKGMMNANRRPHELWGIADLIATEGAGALCQKLDSIDFNHEEEVNSRIERKN